MTTATAPTQLDQENPWPGLESFKENAHAFFYGRDQEAESLLSHVLDAPVTVLYGRSGLGKTSLLQAGLFPMLRDRDLLPVYVRFGLKPGAAPLSHQLRQSVRDSIRADLPDAVLPSDDESLWEYLHGADFELWSAQNYPLTPVIVLDQFEELFTLGERVSDRVNVFRDELGDLAENRIPADLAARIDDDAAVAERFNLRSRNYKLLISLREDFLPHLEEWCRLIPAMGRSRVRLLPLRSGQALDAVRRPAVHLMTEDLARKVVDIIDGEDLHLSRHTEMPDVACAGNRSGATEVEPALLSLFCRELNEERKRRGLSHFDDDLVEDAKRDILSNYYSSCVGDLSPRVAEFIESELITEKGFRDSYVREDAVPAHLTEEELAQLISSRLVRLEDRYGAQRIELTHDVLTGVVREHRDRRRAEEEKAALAARVEQERQALEEAAAERQAELDRERARRLHSERVAKRFRKLSAALALVCVVAVVLAVVSWRLMETAAEARKAAIDSSHTALAEGLSSRAQVMLLSDHSGSEFEAMTKLLAAQHISPSSNVGGQLTALVVTGALRNVIDAPGRLSELSADGHRAITQTPSGIQTLDAETGEKLGTPFADPETYVGGISWDGHYVAVVGSDNSIQVWDSTAGHTMGPTMHDDKDAFVSQASVSADGHRMTTVRARADTSSFQLWDVDAGRPIRGPSPLSEGQVTALTFTRDGRRLATADADGTISLWDVSNGQLVRAMRKVGPPSVDGDQPSTQQAYTYNIAFSPDGSTIAAGVDVTPGGTQLRLWNASTGEVIAAPGIDENGTVVVAFSPDGGRVVTGVDTTEQQWDARGNRIGEPLKFRTPLSTVAYNQRGDRIVSASSQTLQVTDSDADNGLAAETGGSKAAHLGRGDTPFAVYVLDEGPRVATVQRDTLRWLDIDTGDQIGPTVVSDALRGINQFDISPDRKWLAVVGTDNDVRVLDAQTGLLYGAPMKGHEDTVTGVSFSPDGKTLVSSSDDETIRLWDWRNGRQLGDPMSADGAPVGSAFFSKDGRRLYSGSRESVKAWDATTRKLVGEPIPGSFLTTWTVSPDGQRIATVDGTGTIRQWDAGSGKPVGKETPAHFRLATDIEYSADSRYLVSVGMDATLRFWDAHTGEPAGTPVRAIAVGDIQDVALSKDDRRVFVSAWRSDDTGGGGVWEVPGPAAWPDMLCKKLASNPTEAEWKQWVSSDADVGYVKLCQDKPDRP